MSIPGQLNQVERSILQNSLESVEGGAKHVLEIGTWLGGGSTLIILRHLISRGNGRLWGIEACTEIYEAMVKNISEHEHEGMKYFSPVFGFSQKVIPELLSTDLKDQSLDAAFLDGGDNPLEQVEEFQLLEKHIKVGGVLLSHDAKLRKGKWLVPYVSLLDNWKSTLHDVSEEGLFTAIKLQENPSENSRAAAEKQLKKSRREFSEFVGANLPSWACKLILKMMPHNLRRKIGEGRNA